MSTACVRGGWGAVPARNRPRLAILGLAVLAVAGLLLLRPAPAVGEHWLCPDCGDQVVERPSGAATLDCPKCGASYGTLELAPPVAYVNVSTRDTEVVWNLVPPDCRVFRADGVETLGEPGDTLWVPWILVDWYIPRMRLGRLTTGREFRTDYPKERNFCPEPPRFAYEVSDSISLPNRAPQVLTEQGEYSLAELFLVAFTPESRDSARVRFIAEVEAGKHPRLPRTQPHVFYLAPVTPPASEASPDLKADVVIEARVHERRGIIRLRLVESSGRPALDERALALAQQCRLGTAGELGVMVPAWVRLRVSFEGAGGQIHVEPAPRGFWRR